jgi:DNA-binding SARP family transcriptional activator/DNA-binding XRE family transcriptional regulator
MTGENDGEQLAGMGSLVRRYRADLRVTQRELAAAAGMSIGALRDLEQGRTQSPRWETAEGLAAALGLGPAQREKLASAWRPGQRAGGLARPPARVRLEVLGPLAAWLDGAPVALGSGQHRAVLGLLALHAGASVHRDAIIDMLWGARPPDSAVTQVQGCVSRLRRLLDDAAAQNAGARLLVTTGGCRYRLDIASDQLDLELFSRLTREARDAAGQHPAHACRRYERALSLWRGDVLSDIGPLQDHPAAAETARRRTEAVLAYADASARDGSPAQALPHLRALCAREPLNEQAHARLMTALAASGQQAAALRIFSETRRRLSAELGIDPSPVLTRAQTQVLQQQFSPPVCTSSGMPVPPRRSARVMAVDRGYP